MKPIFTIHAGEYLVGTEIEESFPDLRVWLPSKDTGVDLLVTDNRHRKVASLQVKFSKDYLGTGKNSAATPAIRSGGWWKFDQRKIEISQADYWVFVLYQFHTRAFDFVVIPPAKLLERYRQIGVRTTVIQSYFWVTTEGRCWETRGLPKPELAKICDGTYTQRARDFSRFLNAWSFATRR